MKKVLVEINFDKISEDDIIVYDGKKWVVVNKSVFLNDVLKKIDNTDKKIDREIKDRFDLEKYVDSKLAEINEKLNYILGEEEESNNEEEQ